MHRCLTILLLSTVTACAAPPPDLSANAGRTAARRDISNGHIRIYIAGTEASGEVGVESRDKNLVASLSRDHSLPVGCTVPRAPQAVEFARAYNLEIIRYLRDAKSR